MWDVTNEEELRESRKRLMDYDEQPTATGSERLVLPQDVQLTWGPPQSAIVFLDTEGTYVRFVMIWSTFLQIMQHELTRC
jgi:hypothetical protein